MKARSGPSLQCVLYVVKRKACSGDKDESEPQRSAKKKKIAAGSSDEMEGVEL